MSTLSIWKFDTPEGAETALRTLERLQAQRLVVVDDASVVSWQEGKRRPKTYQAGSVAGTAALSGAFWGLLFGLLFLLPIAGMAIGAAAGAAMGLSRLGLSDEFLQQVRDNVTPGTSALFLLTRDAVVDRIAETFEGTHADLLVTNLGREEEAALRAAFSANETEEAPVAS
ncbi:MAG: DUF1269 domain-containing protein [Pseudonocardia sp.]|uniref:DUF1269 domain-containing protein n=1 Tax=unclassified Pseudonocardia TaxID=2619320 RepID=UPI000869C6FF|nr:MULTISPECIES: DUF1269 domain-containing protein [unclassified Pseudonocardia]MBN9113422.1 DUF1269 domain-containing protein [Pseudonocardia sp.]ODU11331.1 MAG: hypothetical protein ABS80_22715 [Pseudonocardia sp. SCN 72-51]ODV03705.1 MAG: hypothetical protein ABT15_21985 [Pseudonocardia sp. SCN 73-27]